MGELAARTIFSNDTGPLAGTGLDTLAKNQGAILELEGAQAPQSKTITAGSISPTAAYVIVDTEGSAAADDLSVISPVLSASENLHTGMLVNLKAADSGRVITVKNTSSANGINTYDGNDYVLSTTYWLKLQLRSGKWYEVEGRAMGTALAAAAAAATPATTTSRGISSVATLADMEPGAVIEDGPAVIDATGGVITPTPTAYAVPQADGDGKLDNTWMPGKANSDLSNLTQAGTTAISHNAMPSSRQIFVAAGEWLLAAADGFACSASGNAQAATVVVEVSANASGSPVLYGSGGVYNYPLVTLPVKKGMYYKIRGNDYAKFIYAEGAY